MQNNLFSLSGVLSAGLVASGCVTVVEREVIVERPVYLASGEQTCSASAAPVSHSASDTLTARGSAGALGPVSAASLVASQLSMGIGPGMSLDEREVLERQVQTVLETSSDGAGVRWVSGETGQVIDFVANETQQEERLVTVARGEEVGRLPASLVVEPAVYVTTEDSILRPTPSATSIVTGGPVEAGQKVKVLGRVTGVQSDSWMLVGGPDGTAYGYLEPAFLRPNVTNLVHPAELYVKPTGTQIRDSVLASVMCRTLVYGAGATESVMRTCREPGGRWISNPPAVEAGGSCNALAKPQPSFLLDK